MSVFEKNLGYRDPNEWDRETCSCIHVVDNEVDTLGWSKSEWPEKASQGAFFAGLLNLIFKSYRILEKKKKNSISKESLGYHRPETPASRRANKEDGFRQMER